MKVEEVMSILADNDQDNINITWGSSVGSGCGGTMYVRLEHFLLGKGRGIARTKKLIKYIQHSHQPEQIERVQRLIDRFNQDYETLVHSSMEMIKSLEGKICKAQINLQRYKADRDRLKKFITFGELNPDWERMNDRVQVSKEDLKVLERMKRSEISENNKRMKDKVFLNQVLELLR